MTDLTHLGWWLKTAAYTNTPVGSDMYKKAILENPEHFPEEYAHIKNWEAIPQEVHDAYRKDWEAMYDELCKDQPESDGIWGAMYNSGKSRNWKEWHDKMYPVELEKTEELRKKHYSKYGI